MNFGFSGTHEYTIVYMKNKSLVEDLNGIPLIEDDYWIMIKKMKEENFIKVQR